MATAGKAGAATATDFISAREIARHMGVTPGALTNWVAAGTWPRAWFQMGRVRLWRRDHYEHFVDTGRWPPEASAARKAR